MSQEGDILWPLTDNLGTVRDLAEYDDATDTTTIADHFVWDSFGNETSGTFDDFLFGFTGRPFDHETGKQNNWERWYDASVGRWLSEDPIGFEAGDANVYRYVGNNAVNATDPDGLRELDIVIIPRPTFFEGERDRVGLATAGLVPFGTISWVMHHGSIPFYGDLKPEGDTLKGMGVNVPASSASSDEVGKFQGEWSPRPGGAGNQYCNKQELDALKKAANPQLVVLEVESIADARMKLDIYLGPGRGNTVRSLTIFGHADETGILVGPKYPKDKWPDRDLKNRETAEALLGGYKHKFRNATITLAGCAIGLSEVGQIVKHVSGCQQVLGFDCKIKIDIFDSNNDGRLDDGRFLHGVTEKPLKPKPFN